MRKFNVKKAVAGVSAAALIFTAGTVIPSYQNVNFVSSITASAASVEDKMTDLANKYEGKQASYFNYKTDWCALFALDCAKEAGGSVVNDKCYGEASTTSLILKAASAGKYHSAVSYNWNYNGKRNPSTTIDRNYVPKPGDIVFIENNDDPSDGPDHTAIVRSVSTDKNGIYTKVYTIEGNMNGYKSAGKEWWQNSKVIKDWRLNSVVGYYSVDYSGSSAGASAPVNTQRTSGTTTYQFTSPVAFRNVTYPINQPAGGTFNVYGKLSTADNSKITKITVDIDEYRNGSYYNVDRTVRYPNTTTYDLHTIDDRIWFNRASKKNTTYRYRIIVEANGKTCIHSKSFKTF